MASVELPAEEVITQLVARGVSDVVVAVVASPQSTVIGGDTQSVRDLVAAWEERGVMAREVAVDVASHSPQVDPILDELYEVLADIEPLEPEVPYYSATSFDPREEPYCDAGYWADNLRHTVRFAAAVQAALEDDFRVFTELSPHPLLTNAVDQTARSLDKAAAALASMRREQPLPHGLRGLLGDLYAAGAALDWAVLYPDGRLLDAPLPTWSQRSLFLATSGLDSVARRSALVPAHPLMGVHVRLPEEPERHVWQGEVGTDALPWLGDHQIRNADVLPGAAYCEMALVAARTVLGEAAEVRDLRFEQSLPLDKQTPVGITATFQGPDVVDFTVESNREGRYERQATAVLHAADPADQPSALNLGELLANHQRPVDGDDIRKWMDRRGHRLGPAFAGLGGAHIAENAGNTVLAEVSLPGPPRPQANALAAEVGPSALLGPAGELGESGQGGGRQPRRGRSNAGGGPLVRHRCERYPLGRARRNRPGAVRRPRSALPPRGDQFRQPRDVGRDPPRLVAAQRHQVARSLRPNVEIDIGQPRSVRVLDDEGGRNLHHAPGRRKPPRAPG